jgi:hypothetical protein
MGSLDFTELGGFRLSEGESVNGESALMDRIPDIKARVNCQDIFRRFWPDHHREGGNSHCPFHYDTTPSLQISGDFAYCHSCESKFDAIDLYQRGAGCSRAEAIEALAREPLSDTCEDIPGKRKRVNFADRFGVFAQNGPSQVVVDYLAGRGLESILKMSERYDCIGFNGDCLVFAIQGWDPTTGQWQIVGLQYIDCKTGEKRFARGTQAKDALFFLPGSGVFVTCESVLDALSVRLVIPDAYACSILSATQVDKIAVLGGSSNHPVLFFDNDRAGKEAAERANQILGGHCKMVDWSQAPDRCKDVNELLSGGYGEIVRRMVETAGQVRIEEDHQNDFEPDLDIKEWPRLSPLALRGIAKDFVELATRSSEADPAAVLVTFLSRFGIEIGTDPHAMIGDKRHPARLFAVIVGSSSKARKGTSADPVRRLFEFGLLRDEAEEDMFHNPARTSPGPLSSGEGLIYAVRDRGRDEDLGEDDKRLFIQDEEFAAALKMMTRKGNVLSTIIRTAFDHGNLEPLTKHDRIKATGAHLGIVTHSTLPELDRLLSHSDVLGGFANRFLWVCSRRQKEVPLPQPMPEDELEVLQRRLLDTIANVQGFGAIEMSDAATQRWCEIYPQLSAERSGLCGAATNRAEAYTRRLALTYALLDGKNVVELEHLEAALALWQYAQDSAKYIFGGKMQNPIAQKILDALVSAPENRLSFTEIHKLLGRHVRKAELEAAINELVATGKVEVGKEKTKGRPRKILFLTKKAK